MSSNVGGVRRKSPKRPWSEKLTSKIGVIKEYLDAIPRGVALKTTILGLIVLLAIIVRILPLRWGLYLSEFDPYQQYRSAKYIVENGFYSWFTWHDNMSWYPWGRNAVTTNYPGLSFTAAVLFNFAQSIGLNISLHELCVFFPVIFGAATCLAIYFFTREVWGETAGLFSALFLSLSASHISRTSLGFFDDETIGLFTMILIYSFFLRATSNERPFRATLIYSLLSGVGLAYLAASWGAFRYAIGVLVLFTFVILLLRRSSSRLVATYSITLGLGYFLMGQIPNIGYSFFREWVTFAVFGTFFLLIAVEGSKRFKGVKSRTVTLGITSLVIAIALIILWREGYIHQLAGRFLSVLNPYIRGEMPLVESVAEHRPATWATFFYEMGIYIFLGLFGFYFITKRFKNNDLFIILFGVTSIYFAGSLVRLTLILSPILLILTAIALVELCKPAVDIVKGLGILPRKKISLPSKVGKEFGVSIILIALIVTTPTFYYSVQAAYAPTTIATSSIPVAPTGADATRYQDWIHALTWMKENLPKDAVVFSWWDYGYWITAMGDKRTLADNGTLNTTQIAVIACTFLSNESQAIPILKQYNVTHVAVFATWTRDEEGQVSYYGYGEDNKWFWMTKIGNGTTVNGVKYNFYQKIFEQYTLFNRILRIDGKIISNNTITDPNGLNDVTMLGKLIQTGINPVGGESDYFKNVFSSVNRFVFISEVRYLGTPMLDLKLDKSSIEYGDSIMAIGQLYEDKEGFENQIVTIESSMNKGETWSKIVDVKTQVNGTFVASWEQNVGSYLIRARWPGIEGKYLGAESKSIQLNMTATNLTLECHLSENRVEAGSSVNITGMLSEPLNTGNLTIQYRFNEENWITLISKTPTNGSLTGVLTLENPGEYYVRVGWSGDYNHNPAVSEERKIIVK